jgi:hypothetical protein
MDEALLSSSNLLASPKGQNKDNIPAVSLEEEEEEDQNRVKE